MDSFGANTRSLARSFWPKGKVRQAGRDAEFSGELCDLHRLPCNMDRAKILQNEDHLPSSVSYRAAFDSGQDPSVFNPHRVFRDEYDLEYQSKEEAEVQIKKPISAQTKPVCYKEDGLNFFDKECQFITLCLNGVQVHLWDAHSLLLVYIWGMSKLCGEMYKRFIDFQKPYHGGT